ncbi:hypothetical protein ACS5PJ_14515 [Pseudarthrobacter sp. YS3]|uniref:hypothetical protein n=1 Tax=Pseudarthrobacter sp. YS3 TaxID=3453718 RepID=UPI003EEB5494
MTSSLRIRRTAALRTPTQRLDIKLSNAAIFGEIMRARGYTVRTLTESVGHVLIRKRSKARISKSTIGHLRSGARSTVNQDVAMAIAELFGLPANALFTPKDSKRPRGMGDASGPLYIAATSHMGACGKVL